MVGEEIHAFARHLWPINRSLTGDGVRQTLREIATHLPELVVHSVSTGTTAFDWQVPKEWNVKQAYILTPNGRKICDFDTNNLHLVGYSAPFRGALSLDELQKHLYSLPDQPEAVPYITSYYSERWGFCISETERQTLEDGIYEVVVDTQLFDGELNFGELILKGECEEEIFLSTYVCHPSMANNELSGPTVVTYLSKWLRELPARRFTYRIIFIPETIGSIVYLSQNHIWMKDHVVAGFNVSCVGDDRAYSFLPSRNGDTRSDRVAKHVLKWTDGNYIAYRWEDRGSDERQYCSPGMDLPIASMMRTKFGAYPEYHTSLDNLETVVTPSGLQGGYEALRKALLILEHDRTYRAKMLCEPQLGKRGLYPTLSTKERRADLKKTMDFLSHCDGESSLFEIAEKIDVPCWELFEAAKLLVDHEIIEEIPASTSGKNIRKS